MKSILLYVDDDTAHRRLTAAIGLARTFDARLTCLQAIPTDVHLGGLPYAGVYPTSVFDRIDADRQRAEIHRAAFERQLRANGIEWNWLREDRNPAFALVEHGKLADIVVMGLPTGTDAAVARSLVSDLAITIRAPVLAVPEAAPAFDCRGIAAVAWNGSVEAAHALRTTRPLLAKAAAVHIVTITNDDTLVPAQAAADYLAKYEIASRILELECNHGCIGDALLEAAGMLEGAYLVAGAYGHSRFREGMLGGVTRELLETAAVPLLLVH